LSQKISLKEILDLPELLSLRTVLMKTWVLRQRSNKNHPPFSFLDVIEECNYTIPSPEDSK
jgi:hypothetical protein